MHKGRSRFINVLFGISFTLKRNNTSTTRINCFHLWSVIFQIGNLCRSFMWTRGSTAGVEGRVGNCRQPLLGGSYLPFSPLLRLSREFSHAIQENRRFQLITIVGIHKSLPDTWLLTLGTRSCSFIFGNICFKFSEQYCSEPFCPSWYAELVFGNM